MHMYVYITKGSCKIANDLFNAAKSFCGVGYFNTLSI